MPHSSGADWTIYPLCLPRGDADANNLHQHLADLDFRSPELFTAATDGTASIQIYENRFTDKNIRDDTSSGWYSRIHDISEQDELEKKLKVLNFKLPHLRVSHAENSILNTKVHFCSQCNNIKYATTYGISKDTDEIVKTHGHAVNQSLDSVVANNWEYLECLSDQLLSLDKRAAFPRALNQYDLDISKSQEAHSIKKRLFHMKTVLDGTLRVAVALSSLTKELRELENITKSTHDITIRHLGNISRDLEAHKSTTDELLNWSCDIQSMINLILDFRNQDSLKENGVQLKAVAQANRQEAQASAMEAHHMADIARQTYADSRTMRIATVIALIYLPASLVMAFFSTIFVDIPKEDSNDLNPADTSGPKNWLFISDKIWIEFVSIIVLVTATAGIFLLWQKKMGSKNIPLAYHFTGIIGLYLQQSTSKLGIRPVNTKDPKAEDEVQARTRIKWKCMISDNGSAERVGSGNG
ncbi:hypothetical protein TWF970_002300 [Orbilia oligospora]|uniref:Uncharacterized protein n=1 Tax=Orbilia oligospora TaxID=2813651 RepID=A0A7C8RCF7_ORBOL|nr:hypothetical protein TWF970_002300 [Orbilia oligospora]